MRFAELLATPGVDEELTLRSTFGLLAYHGGHLEKVTDIVAREVAERTNSSYYGVLHADDVPTHVSSKYVDPAASEALTSFLDHVDIAVSLHGYGRDHLKFSMLLGGQNRALASHISTRLRADLGSSYEAIDDLESIPRELRGLHDKNPVNLPRQQGCQIELPPTIRWNWDDHNWSDHGDAGRAPQVDELIDSLASAISDW